MKIFCLTQILLILISHGASAQWHKQRRTVSIAPWEIGISAGISTFVTSVNPASGAPNKEINYWNRDVNPGFGLSVLRNISPTIGVEMNYLNTRLTGSWNNSFAPFPTSGTQIPSPFQSRINQIDLMVAFNINQMILPGDEEDPWHLYLKTGIGLTNIKNFDKFQWGIDYINTRMSFAFDAGVSVSLTDKVKLLLGNTIRSVITDNLDGVFVVSSDSNGKPVNWMSVYELYNYTYLRVSYSLGGFGSNKSKNVYKNKNGRYRAFRKR